MIKETKVCNKCGVEKSISEFRLKKHKGTYVLNYICNDCEKIQAKIYREKNRKTILEKNRKNYKESYQKYKEKTLIYQKEYRKNHKQQIKDYKKKYYLENKEQINAKSKKYRNENKELIRKSQKNWRENNKVEKASKDKLYYEKNKNSEEFKNKRKDQREKYKQRRNMLEKERFNNDTIYKFKKKICLVIREAFIRKKQIKDRNTLEILGCDYETFVNYLLNTYKENYGEKYNNSIKVHIDHIVPLKTATTVDDIIRLNHYTNLQLLKAEDNLHKGAKLDWRLDDVK